MKGYTVTCVGTAEAAIETIKQTTVDLVLTDIKMPGMSGVELLKWVREYNRTLPVVMTTGFPTLDTAIEALKLGAFDYLTKPFHLEEIAEKIKRALVNRQLEEENCSFPSSFPCMKSPRSSRPPISLPNSTTRSSTFP